MDGLQVSIACLLLKMAFDPCIGQLLVNPGGCPVCPEGYFVTKNCSEINRRLIGIQCKLCKDCSASHQDTLVQCSTFADSLCGNRTAPVVTTTSTPTEAPVSAPGVWIYLTVIIIPLVLVLLGFVVIRLRWVLTRLSCQYRQCNKVKGLDPV